MTTQGEGDASDVVGAGGAAAVYVGGDEDALPERTTPLCCCRLSAAAKAASRGVGGTEGVSSDDTAVTVADAEGEIDGLEAEVEEEGVGGKVEEEEYVEVAIAGRDKLDELVVVVVVSVVKVVEGCAEEGDPGPGVKTVIEGIAKLVVAPSFAIVNFNSSSE